MKECKDTQKQSAHASRKIQTTVYPKHLSPFPLLFLLALKKKLCVATAVLINLWAVMHDPKIWERPEEFDPSRFLTEDGQKVITPEAFIPFSIGAIIVTNCMVLNTVSKTDCYTAVKGTLQLQLILPLNFHVLYTSFRL